MKDGMLRYGILSGSLVLLLVSFAGGLPQLGDNEGTIRGATFLDNNRNGVMDAGEPGVGGVYFTISAGDYSQQYYSEPRTTDDLGHTFATGTYGPVPLPRGVWHVSYQVPSGYVATTPTELDVYVPGSEGNHVGWAYLGLYPGSGGTPTLPHTGLPDQPALRVMLALFGVAAVGAVGLGLLARKRA